MLRRSLFTLLIVPLIILGLLAVPARASDETSPEAAAAAAKAEALMKDGKIAEARDAYAALAEANPDNEVFARQAEVLGRVLDLEAFLVEEDVSPTWERAAIALHGFYLRSGLPRLALKLDRATHARGDSATTASLVVETLLEMDANEEAVAFVENLREGQKTHQNEVYQCIALARLGRMDEVRETLRLSGPHETKDAGLLYDMARLQALLGEKDTALSTLATAFENCPASALATLKECARKTSDFATLKSSEAFAKVLETESKAGSCGHCGGNCDDCDHKEDGTCDGEKDEEGGCDHEKEGGEGHGSER